MAEDLEALKVEFSHQYGPFFTFDEFRCKCGECPQTGEWFRRPEFRAFMILLMRMRRELGFPFTITSGYRCPEYNDSLYQGDGSHLDGPHTKGAADILVSFERAYDLIQEAMGRQMGVGAAQKGDVAGRFVHVDNLGRRFWTY